MQAATKMYVCLCARSCVHTACVCSCGFVFGVFVFVKDRITKLHPHEKGTKSMLWIQSCQHKYDRIIIFKPVFQLDDDRQKSMQITIETPLNASWQNKYISKYTYRPRNIGLQRLRNHKKIPFIFTRCEPVKGRQLVSCQNVFFWQRRVSVSVTENTFATGYKYWVVKRKS